MARDISILFSLKDRFTGSLKGITKNQKQFKKDMMSTSLELTKLYDKKRTLQLDNKSANRSIKDTSKNANKLGGDLQATMNKAVEAKVKTQFALDDINKKIKETQKGLNKVNGTRANPRVKLDDQATKPLQKIGGLLNSLSFSHLAGIGSAIGAGAGIYKMFSNSLSVSGELEQTQIALETMLKSEKAGKKLMADLSRFAIETPFQMKDLAQQSQFALAMGFKGNDILSLLTDAGNAASGTGKGTEGLENIIRALGQMHQKGKVSAQEINQLAENGIGAWGYLAKAIGKSTAETMKLAEEGLLPAEKAIEAIRKGMRKDYSGMMIKQSKTLFGLLSSLKDFADLNIFKSFGDGIREGIQPSLISLVDSLSKGDKRFTSMQEKLKSLGKTIGDFIANNAKGLIKYFDKLFGQENFKNADLGGKAKIVLDDMFKSMKDWYDGGGGDKVKGIFESIAKKSVDTLIWALIDAKPKLKELGISLAESISEGIADGLDKKLPFYEERKKKGWTLSNLTSKAMGAGELGLENAIPFALPAKGVKKVYNFVTGKTEAPKKAFGMSRVPYNNYPIIAHEGEKLLTKQEANRKSSSDGITIHINGPVTVREEADIIKLAKEFAKQLKQTSGNMGVAY